MEIDSDRPRVLFRSPQSLSVICSVAACHTLVFARALDLVVFSLSLLQHVAVQSCPMA
jgi:hypothetical protein